MSGNNVEPKRLSDLLEKKGMKRCEIVLTKGKRNGLPCNRKINVDGDDFCKFHLVKSVETVLCTVIVTKGERKNQICNRKVVSVDEQGNAIIDTLCKSHRNIENKRPYNPFIDKERSVNLMDRIAVSDLGTIELDLIDKGTAEIVYRSM